MHCLKGRHGVKEGIYLEIYQAKKKLEKEGFNWSEKP